ncbi:MAG: peptidyl-prolyl cis-trans isomerase [Gemmatimonadota bacterium]|nr:peptidyl-prolyl cis-trans isomerase [Gemmatimonadota bacterium]
MLQSMRSSAKYIWWLLVITFIGVFIFAETSGLSSRNVTRGSSVGSVNGETITVDMYDRAVRALTDQAQQQGRSLTLDDQRRLEEQAFNQIVTEMLIRQELDRRGIHVTPEEIQQAALTQPPPELINNPELHTDGRFDPDKYERFLRSPAAKQQGLLTYLEGYYRNEIPKVKLAQQLATGVYVSEAQLWNMYRDTHDSAEVSFVALNPEMVPDSLVTVTDAEIRDYYREREDDLGERPGRAVLSLVTLPRPITSADTAATRERAVAMRNEVLAGASFEAVARRESADTASLEQGGLYEGITPGRFVKPFEDAAFALDSGGISEPVLTQHGFHIIKVEAKRGDTVDVRHILVPIAQSESAAAVTDRLADQLARLAAEAEEPDKLDSAATEMRLSVARVEAIEGNPLMWSGQYVADVSAWAFGGAEPGETSSLFDSPDAYYLARLDSLTEGGKPTLDAAREEIRAVLAREKKIEALAPRARDVAGAVAGGTTLEQAAAANDLSVQRSGMFTRTSAVAGMGRLNEAIGAAFALAAGAVSAPIETRNSVFVIRVERRVPADRGAWEAQKATQRDEVMQQLRQQRVQQFLGNLREAADIEDERRRLREAMSGAATT